MRKKKEKTLSVSSKNPSNSRIEITISITRLIIQLQTRAFRFETKERKKKKREKKKEGRKKGKKKKNSRRRLIKYGERHWTKAIVSRSLLSRGRFLSKRPWVMPAPIEIGRFRADVSQIFSVYGLHSFWQDHEGHRRNRWSNGRPPARHGRVPRENDIGRAVVQRDRRGTETDEGRFEWGVPSVSTWRGHAYR